MAFADPKLAAARLRMALEMHEEGVWLMRQNLRRRHPDATEPTIDRLLGNWLSTRPGAEHGDAKGIPRRWESWLAEKCC
jgi:hypothetical protein